MQAGVESPTRLIGEVRQPIKAKAGQRERYDCEYKRNGTANPFIVVDGHRPWRKVKVTDSRTAIDFAACMRELADVHFPKQSASASCWLICPPTRPEHSSSLPRLPRPGVCCRLEFHYVPKHASWLNMVEIEIGDRRIDSNKRLVSEFDAWERQRNTSRGRIKWMFTTEKAMGRAYPKLAGKESKSL